MRDQRLVLRQLQPEFVTQERRQALFDLLGLGPGSGEPEQGVVGLCRVLGYAAPGGSRQVSALL
jgi:hypothetical protein